MKRIRPFFICILILLLTASIRPAYAEATQAEDLTDSVRFDFGANPEAANRILKDRGSYYSFRQGEAFTLTWDTPIEGARLCISWQEPAENVSVVQYTEDGTVLKRETPEPHPDSVIPLLKEARSAAVEAGETGMKVLFCAVYGPGELSEPFHEWQETPDHLDYLLISTHPDDDVLYLGSIVPTYGAEQGYVGTIVYVTCQNRVRADEAENGAWTMGLRYRPVFLGMKDVYNGASKELKDMFPYSELLLNTVRVYRRLRPLVVFAQDLNGEYGHWQHKRTAKAAREAFALAADPEFDPESAAQYGTWQVQKLYLHLFQKNKLTVDAHTPLAFFGGRDAFKVAREAYLKHVSQQRYSFRVRRDDGAYAFNRFGMAEGIVPSGNDVFDNIDEKLLSGYVEPTPTPEPAPTSKPTEAPAPSPTPTVVPAAPASAETTQKTAPKPDAQGLRPLLWIGVITAAAAVGVGAAAYFWKKRQIAKHPPDENA